MAKSPFNILLLTSLLNEWKLSKGVETLTCPSSSSIQIGPTTTTFQFGDGSTLYDKTLSCTWTFTASDSSASLVIGQNLKCGASDELEISGGGTSKKISCCFDCTKEPVIKGNTATVTFTSDSTQTPEDIGFSLEIFAGMDESGCTSGNNTFNIPISSPYVITSPNFPGYYPKNIDCSYTFTPVPPSLGLVISFQFINLDYDSGCYDNITLNEGDMNGNQIAKICQGYGKNNLVISPNETYRTSGALFLHFYSDSLEQARGFKAMVSQDSTSGNTETTTTVATESTTRESSTQSTTASTTTESTTQLTTLVSATATTTSVLTSSLGATAENTSPTPSEAETTSPALESTTTKITPTSSPTSQVESIETTTLTQQASSTTLGSTVLTQEQSSTTIETTTPMIQPPSTTQDSTSSTQHLSTEESIESTTLTQQASSTTLGSTVLTQELSSTTIETTTSMLETPSTTQESTSSTQHLSTVDSTTTFESTTSTQQVSLSTTEDITSSQQHSSTLVIESTTTPRPSTTTVVTSTDLSYLDRLGFTPTTFAAMTTGVSFLILVTIGIFVLLMYTIHRKNKLKHKPQKKYKRDETCKKNDRKNMYNLRSYPTAFNAKNRKPLFYYYW